MFNIQPFQAVRPVRNKVCIVPSKPYESYTHSEVNRILKSNPYSFLNIIASHYIRRLPKEKRFKAIRKQYEKFKKRGVYIQDYLPFFYVMRVTDEGGNMFTGIVGLINIEDYKEGKILRHENILTRRVNAFSEYLSHVHIQADPVLLTYAPQQDINFLMNKTMGQVPEYEFSTTDGTVFEVWLISDFDDIKKVQKHLGHLRRMYIADGHHRVESTLRMQEEMKKNNPYHTGNEAYNYLLSYFISFDQLKIYPFHRGLKDLNGMEADVFLKRLSEKFDVKRLDKFIEPDAHSMILYTGDAYYQVKIPKKYFDENNNIVGILNDEIFKGILKMKDPSKTQKIKYLQGKPGLKCVLRKIKESECCITFFLPPLSFNDIKSIADEQKTLPPKSTYIDPKLLTGLFVYEF
jgi:uncharacterized protein (DUF1015 family)